MNPGDVFRYGPSGHDWIVVSDPALDPEHVLIVNLTSNKSWQDQSCIIRRGEHPSAHSNDVVAFYAKARIVSNSELDALLSSGGLQLREPLESALLQRVKSGALRSDRIPFDCRQLLRGQGLAP